jgi:phage tail-like protein
MTHLRRTSALIAVLAVLGAAIFLATTADQARPAPTTAGSYHYKLTLGGHEPAGGIFRLTLGASSNEVVLHAAADDQGKARVQKFPGQLSWGDVTVRRYIDKDHSFADWRQEVVDGKINDARRDGSIEMIDWQGKTVATWSFVRAWPSRYAVSSFSDGSTSKPYETITLAHEGFVRR